MSLPAASAVNRGSGGCSPVNGKIMGLRIKLLVVMCAGLLGLGLAQRRRQLRRDFIGCEPRCRLAWRKALWEHST
jgi:hypothetical protein